MIMNTRELMIGDFVYSEYEERVIKVREVENFSVIYEEEFFSGLDNEIHPIRLTDEMLSANYERKTIRCAEKWTIDEQRRLYLAIYHWEGEDHYEVFNGVEIRYVHELQHVLRLCGEYEMADNLKLE